MSNRTNDEVLTALNEIDELRDRLMRQYPSITQRDADDAAEWAYEEIRAAVAAERERCAAICMKAGDTALANRRGEIAGAMYVTVAAIRAGDGEGD